MHVTVESPLLELAPRHLVAVCDEVVCLGEGLPLDDEVSGDLVALQRVCRATLSISVRIRDLSSASSTVPFASAYSICTLPRGPTAYSWLRCGHQLAS